MRIKSPISYRRHGFTVVELLVSITIVAVLASLIFALTQRGLKKAKAVQCVQNLRDWSMVFNQSSSDRNGRLWLPDNWAAISHTSYDPNRREGPGRSPFVDYWDFDIDTAFQIQLEKRGCPLIRDEAGTTSGGNPSPTYRLNVDLREPRTQGNRTPLPEVHLTRLRRASTKVLFVDGHHTGNNLTLERGDLSEELKAAGDVHGSGKVNAVFADMHVAPLNISDLENEWERYVERPD